MLYPDYGITDSLSDVLIMKENNNNMDLSILIVNWNTADLVKACIESVFKHVQGFDFEVIVVDNNSSDSSVSIIKDTFPEVDVIENDTNKGFVAANNQAFNISKGRNILLLNSDTLVLDNSMREIVDYLDSNPFVGIVTGKILNEDGSFQRPFKRFPHWAGSYFRHTTRLIYGFSTPFHKRYCMENLDQNKPSSVDWVSGAYLFAKRSLLDKDAVLDSDIFMYCEDALLCYNVSRKGFKVCYLPIAPIVHYGGKSAKTIRSFTAYNSFKGTSVFIRKVYGGRQEKIFNKSVILTWHFFASLFYIGSLFNVSIFSRKLAYFKDLIRFYRKEKSV